MLLFIQVDAICGKQLLLSLQFFSYVGDGDDIVLPKISDSVDWEVELAVVIGKEGKHIKVEQSMLH